MELYVPPTPEAAPEAALSKADELNAQIHSYAESQGLVVLGVIASPASPDVALGVLVKADAFDAEIKRELAVRYDDKPRTEEEAAGLGNLEITLVYHTGDRDAQEILLPLRDAGIFGPVMANIENAMGVTAMKMRLGTPGAGIPAPEKGPETK